MRLFALRGANSVDANQERAILQATDLLMRELMERNRLEPDRMVSCIFTLTDDLDAEFPVPGSLPRVIRVLVHYYAPDGHEPRHVYLGEARVLRADLESAQ